MKKTGPLFSLLFAMVVVAPLGLAGSAKAAVFDVDRTDDDGTATACTAAADDCSLRGAVITANGNGAADTINLQATTYTLGPSASTCEDAAADGDLDITDSLTIVGNGATVDGAGLDRVFDLTTSNGNFSVQMSDLTVQNGAAHLNVGPCNPGGTGGGFQVAAGLSLSLSRVTVTLNTALDGGGGIANNGTLDVQDSTISSNQAGNISPLAILSANGGGIFNQFSGVESIARSTISGNTAVAGLGGGIYDNNDPFGVTETTRVVESTISGNSADDGGGVYADANLADSHLNFINSTVSGNTAVSEGGGIFVCYGTVSLRNVTVTANSAGDDNGGGGVSLPPCGESQLNIRNTILAGNFNSAAASSPDCFREDPSGLTSEGFNLIGNETGCDGLFAGDPFVGTSGSPVNPGIGSLADNGGPTLTHALLLSPLSPAIDAGNPAGCFSNDTNDGAPLTTDQRGSPRPLDGGAVGPTPAVCDIGAFELGGCGDGFQDPSEACDDGNTTGGDGCSATCQLEGCGDGVVIPPEQCDDGNTVDGDGCSANCVTEVPTPVPTPTALPVPGTQGGCMARLTPGMVPSGGGGWLWMGLGLLPAAWLRRIRATSRGA